jgi:hypothetical protein
MIFDNLTTANRVLRYLFGGTSVANVTVPATLRTIDLTGGTNVPDSFFIGLTSITDIFLPDSLLTIGNSSFQDLTNVVTLTLPSGVTTIGNLAFQGMSKLVELTIPNTVTTIGNSAFRDLTGLVSITLPNTLTSIGESTFQGTSLLTTLVVPNTVTTIGPSAFRGMSQLTSITLPQNLTSIGLSAFQNVSSLTSLVIPNTVTVIGADAFRDMAALTSITFPSTMPTSPATFSLGTNVLTGATSLTTMNFHIDMLPTPASGNRVLRYFFGGSTTVLGATPNTLTTVILNGGTVLSAQFFLGNINLINVTLPSTLIEIQTLAFDGATGIKELTIPASVATIGASAFRAMTGLSDLTFLRATVATLGTTIFATSSSLATPPTNLRIIVPTQEALDLYIQNPQFAPFNTGDPVRITIAPPVV